jgi:Ring finger domain
MNANHGDSGTLLTTSPGGLVESSGSGISGDQDGSLDRADDEEQHDGNAAAIPQVCLALAKDSRYLAHSELLLMQMLKGWNVPMSVSVQKLLATILLYSPLLLVSSSSSRRHSTTRTTYGMEACGVDFASAAAGEIISRRKLAIASIGLAAFYAYAESYMVQQESRRSTSISNDNDNNKNFEALKGKSRRNAYERQREKMMQGGTRLRNSRSSVVGQSQCNSDSSLRERLQSLPSSALRLFISAYKTVSATSPGFGGPHMRAGDESWDDTPPSTVLWLIRLHSALYLIKGKYPTLLHRLVNIQLRNSQSRSKAGANAQQSEYAMMGLLLASFSFVVLLKIAAKSLFERVGSSRASSSSSLLADSTTVSASAHSEVAARSCMICGAERRHPSCSVHCGHVFCWNCLHSWIQTRTKGCPLCKTPCSTHDVVYLRNYT